MSLSRDSGKRLNVNSPLLVDVTGVISMRFRAIKLPVYILLDSEGRLRRRLVGFRDERVFEALVNEVVVAAATGSPPVD
jgi:hypothetical protein